MKISILFATYNGEKTLPVMLDAMTQVAVPDGGMEIIAVDNGSTDRSAEVLESYSDTLNIKVINVPERGKNRALNKGVECVVGEIVVLTDDDIIPDRKWLSEIVSCVQAYPDFSVFGGRIKASWPRELPSYIKEHVPLGMTFAISPDDIKDGPVDPTLIWGANMAIRRDVFENGFRFNENVGPASGNYIMGSETELTVRLNDSGYKCYFLNEAVVKHIVRDGQFSKRWLWGRSFRSGRSLCFNKIGEHRKEYATVFGIPAWVVKKAIYGYLSYLFYSLTGDSNLAFSKRFAASRWYGYIVQAIDSNASSQGDRSCVTKVSP